MTHPLPQQDRAKPSIEIAIIGSGASCLYLLKNTLGRIDSLRGAIRRIVVFERGDRAGMGMPYHPATTDRYNLCNISSEELPRLQETLVDWLRERDDATLARFDLRRDEISETETYARIALGEYFEAQFDAIVAALRDRGIDVDVRLNADVSDVRDDPSRGRVVLIVDGGEETFDRVVVSTGHAFDEPDAPDHGYFGSPWPIQKLLPPPGETHDTTIGILGASLSAFDVVTSLAHRHGTFEDAGGRLRFVSDPRAGAFRLVLHSSKGWLPHLQYEQCRPFREVYRFIGRTALLAMRDGAGFLRLGDYFDVVCRPALGDAFARDGRRDVAMRLLDRGYSLETFVEELSAEHAYDDAFDGLRREYAQASRQLRDELPVHWKETLDDLMYTLSYHADLMPAEDHGRFREVVQPFLMNVIAAMPLGSARILMALHDAGRISLMAGRATVRDKRDGATFVDVKGEDGTTTSREYRLFVDCTGQAPTTLENYPFPTLVAEGTVRPARARFADESARTKAATKSPDRLIDSDDGSALRLDGIDVDAAYRVIGADGAADPRIHDIAFPHTAGVRPYSYGLQACNHTAGVVVEAWHVEADCGSPPTSQTSTLTRLHGNVANED